MTEVKRDMESSRVMDRLLVGDVGYGKTEVAVRAAFKAVMDGRQVALLAPTTVLAVQHLRDLPPALRALSRAGRDGLPLPYRGDRSARPCRTSSWVRWTC